MLLFLVGGGEKKQVSSLLPCYLAYICVAAIFGGRRVFRLNEVTVQKLNERRTRYPTAPHHYPNATNIEGKKVIDSKSLRTEQLSLLVYFILKGPANTRT